MGRHGEAQGTAPHHCTDGIDVIAVRMHGRSMLEGSKRMPRLDQTCSTTTNEERNSMTQPRPHAETIIAWANGAQIQYRTKSPGTDWKDCDDPAFVADYEYRVKPAREYPETKLTENDMWCIYDEVRGPTIDALNAVANTALRHAIDAGQVVTREEFDRAIGDRNKRDIAVAEAVKAEMALRFGPMSLSAIGIACLDVEPILSKVKA